MLANHWARGDFKYEGKIKQKWAKGEGFEGYDNHNIILLFKDFRLHSLETYHYSIQRVTPCCDSKKYFLQDEHKARLQLHLFRCLPEPEAIFLTASFDWPVKTLREWLIQEVAAKRHRPTGQSDDVLRKTDPHRKI